MVYPRNSDHVTPRQEPEKFAPHNAKFSIPKHQDRFNYLCTHRFRYNQCIDWPTLRSINLEDKVRELVSVLRVEQASFCSRDRLPGGNFGSIWLIRVWQGWPDSEKYHSLSLIDFILLLRFYNQEYVLIKKYTQFEVYFPMKVTSLITYHYLNCGNHESRVSEATTFSCTVYR